MVTRGISGGQTVHHSQIIDSIEEVFSPYSDYSRFLDYAKSPDLKLIISNTTEAGIVFDESDSINMLPAATYPGKLTQFLYERFLHYCGSAAQGLILLPVELIDNNGDMLKDCVLRYARHWELPSDFITWIETACTFCNTLVDRIVSGYPTANAEEMFEELGYADHLLTVAEPFGLWVIEAPEHLRNQILPGCEDLPILFTDDCRPYKQRKVRILNGAHTSMAMLAYLCGRNYVNESMADPLLRAYTEQIIYKEVIPCLTLPEEELLVFAEAVMERFENPFLEHALLSISLNSVSKWRARCLPSLLDFLEKYGKLPACLTFSLAALLKFYKGSVRETDGQSYDVKDNEEVLDFFRSHRESTNAELVRDYLSCEAFHGRCLAEIPSLCELVTGWLNAMDQLGVNQALSSLLEQEVSHE